VICCAFAAVSNEAVNAVVANSIVRSEVRRISVFPDFLEVFLVALLFAPAKPPSLTEDCCAIIWFGLSGAHF
jgi:hypothetical protein